MNFGIDSFNEISRERILEALDLVRRNFPVSSMEKVDSVWVKFESENPTGAFKVRGGLVYFEWLKAKHPEVRTVVAATRGNHGQSVALAASRSNIQCVIVVPHGNSLRKNQAMQRLGAELIEYGDDFAESLEFAQDLAQRRQAHFVPSFDWKLVLGVATYGFEMFSDAPEIDAVYVPIGLGSGICGVSAARRAVNSNAAVIGVVAENAPIYADSFAAGRIVKSSHLPNTMADGVACRMVSPQSFPIIQEHVTEILRVPESEIERAVRDLHHGTGHRVEGAGAIAFAAHQRHQHDYDNPAVIVSGGNIDDDEFDRLVTG